ncbi:hypothetical protein JCM5296_004487 [Sporobolomyces johnsonii]
MASAPATLLGVPLSLISLVTLTVQNSALTIVLHYSRISVPKDKMYSAASAVLLNELLKGAISLSIAFRNAVHAAPTSGGGAGLGLGEYAPVDKDELESGRKGGRDAGLAISVWEPRRIKSAARKTVAEVFSNDCWKLSIPACLYVIQNNLQFVAASNLDVPTFQVTYNLKILTTALFSVFLLRRRLSAKKWFALLFLAAGVGVVQLQSTAAAGGGSKASHGDHEMDKFRGLCAVAAACMTSGLAGVYFEMVLKGSKADLWIRNVQLSFFSLLPALFAVFAPGLSLAGGASAVAEPVERQPIFANFGGWAWAVVLIQVFGGLVTALVIRYSDNIMKGFATSLAIVLSFCAGIILFDFQVTASFLVGSMMVTASTYMYNAPDSARRAVSLPSSVSSASTTSSLLGRSFNNPAPNQTSHMLHSTPSYAPSPPPSASSASSVPDQPYSPAQTLRSSSSGTAPAAAAPSYRRPNPQALPHGAQTPDHTTAIPLFSPLENALATASSPAALVSGGGHYVSSTSAARSSSPGSTSTSNSTSNANSHLHAQQPPRAVSPVPGVHGLAARSQSPEATRDGEGFSSGMAAGLPGSPDPSKRRGTGPGAPPRWT